MPRLLSIVNVQHTFVPSMLHQENPSVIINTGSKQGITNPPCVPSRLAPLLSLAVALPRASLTSACARGNAAYNASKAAVKSLTEGLAYELRNVPHAKVTAHLLM